MVDGAGLSPAWHETAILASGAPAMGRSGVDRRERVMSSGACTNLDEADMPAEGDFAAFDRVVRREMGMSGEEFLRRWDAGEWDGVDLDDVPGLPNVWILLPMVRGEAEGTQSTTEGSGHLE